MTKHHPKDGDEKHSHKHSHMDDHDKHSLNHVLFDLIKSVANEEEALALLIEAEADKIQAFIGTHSEFPTKPSNKEILDLNRSVTQMLETIVMKEWLLLKKLERTLEAIHIPREDCEDFGDYQDFESSED
ncbi:hypothetical protein ACFVSW_17750 [Neobacillus sp. NPDC058068]|uniref:hypothetical protein n=1 Tax=Neobacillus sp. NPDC058068 TaxID=3346325 RepID=UPI0036D90AF8